MGDDTEPASTFAALGQPLYRRIWYAQVVSMVGNWMQITGRAVLVFQITGSTAALGTVYLFSYLPQLLFSTFGGVFADRYDRRRLLMVMQGLGALGALAIGVLADTDTATLVNVSAVSFLVGSVQTIQGPVSNALVPALVERRALASAVSIQSATANASRIVGPMLAAAAIPVLGVAWMFYANALSFTIAIVAWAATPISQDVDRPVGRTLPAIGEGFRVVRRSPDLWVPIVILAFVSGVGMVYQPLGVALTTDDLAGGDKDDGASLFGLLQAALGLGAVIGVLAVAKVSQRSPGTSLLWSSVGFSIALIALGATDLVFVVLPVAVLLGGFHFAHATVAMNVVQHQVTEELRGRVMGIHMLAFVGVFPVTSWIGGQVADVIGTRQTLVGAGVACLAFTLQAFRWRDHVRIDGPDPDPADELIALGSVPDEER